MQVPNKIAWASLVAQRVKHPPAMWETRVQISGQEDLLEKEVASHSRTLTWTVPWMEVPAKLPSTGLQSHTQLSNFKIKKLN